MWGTRSFPCLLKDPLVTNAAKHCLWQSSYFMDLPLQLLSALSPAGSGWPNSGEDGGEQTALWGRLETRAEVSQIKSLSVILRLVHGDLGQRTTPKASLHLWAERLVLCKGPSRMTAGAQLLNLFKSQDKGSHVAELKHSKNEVFWTPCGTR